MEYLRSVSIANAVCRSANKRTIFLRINSESFYSVQYEFYKFHCFRTFINRNLNGHCVVGIHCQKKPAVRGKCVRITIFLPII